MPYDDSKYKVRNAYDLEFTQLLSTGPASVSCMAMSLDPVTGNDVCRFFATGYSNKVCHQFNATSATIVPPVTSRSLVT